MEVEKIIQPFEEIHLISIFASESDRQKAKEYLLRVLKDKQANLPAVTSETHVPYSDIAAELVVEHEIGHSEKDTGEGKIVLVLSLDPKAGVRNAFLGYKASLNISTEDMMRVSVGKRRDQMSKADRNIFKKFANQRMKKNT